MRRRKNKLEDAPQQPRIEESDAGDHDPDERSGREDPRDVARGVHHFLAVHFDFEGARWRGRDVSASGPCTEMIGMECNEVDRKGRTIIIRYFDHEGKMKKRSVDGVWGLGIMYSTSVYPMMMGLVVMGRFDVHTGLECGNYKRCADRKYG